MDDRLARIAETRSQFAARKQSKSRLSFERRAIRKILRLLGWEGYVKMVVEDDMDMTFTFSWFADEFPNFPMRLASGYGVDDLTISQLLAKTRLGGKIGRLWSDAWESVGGKMVGLVVQPGDTLLSGWWVLHNREGQVDGPAIMRIYGDHPLYFERLEDLLRRLGGGIDG